MIVHKIYQKDGSTIEFVPVANVPGFTHRVILNSKPVDWLSRDFKPSIKAAEYYFEKHEMKTKPTLADGVEFTLGMTIYLDVYTYIETNETDFEIDSFHSDGQEYHCIDRKGTLCGTDLRRFYSIKSAAIDVEIGKRRQSIEALEAEITELEAMK